VSIDLDPSACTGKHLGKNGGLEGHRLMEVTGEDMIILLWNGLMGLFVAQSKRRFKSEVRLDFDVFVQIWQAVTRSLLTSRECNQINSV
jgi:hypothetical protein